MPWTRYGSSGKSKGIITAVYHADLLEVLLVVFLSSVELGGSHNLGGNGLAEFALVLLLGGGGQRTLSLAVVENRRAVLRSNVISLTTVKAKFIKHASYSCEHAFMVW